MLIIPLEKSIDWRKPPFITFLLILINTLILIFSNSHDDKAYEKAFNYYFGSDLPKIELVRYLQIQQQRTDSDNQAIINALENNSASNEMRFNVLMQMQNNQDFIKQLKADEIITALEEIYPLWKEQRGEFDRLLNKTIIDNYGFIPAKHKPLTFLTHQFLHGGYGHLIGNMLFLFLIGVTLETALGSFVYLICYLISGLGAVTLYWLVYSSSEMTLVGASGAISGLMGMYAGVFGLRKIRFFYSLLFYFDYIKAPALIMLPLWMLNEIYQLIFIEGSNVAYMAHLGGLLTGGLISFTIKHYFETQIDTAYLNSAQQQEEKERDYEQGMKLLRELKFPQAQKVFAGLHHSYPNEIEILIQYYKTLKYTQDKQEYQRITLKIFEMSDIYEIKNIVSVFKDYTKSQPIANIPSNVLLKLSFLFSKANYLYDAETVIHHLLNTAVEIDGLDQALFTLANGWKRLNELSKYSDCLNLGSYCVLRT
jgi:membrane associated rhomboid family serine protease